MPLKIVHRPDQLLQKSAAKPCEPGLEDTFIGQVTIPTHKELLKFLDKKVIGRTFKNEEELRKVLEEWPTFCLLDKEFKIRLAKDFRELWITRRGTIAAASGMGGDFEIALIREVDGSKKVIESSDTQGCTSQLTS